MTQLIEPPQPQQPQPASNLISFHVWIEELGVSRNTGHVWRRKYPWLAAGVKNVFGKLYITRDTIREFESRAIAGEFEKNPYGACGKWMEIK